MSVVIAIIDGDEPIQTGLELKMKCVTLALCSLFLAVTSLVASTPAHCEEELAPGFAACIDKAVSMADNIDCVSAAYQYWDKKLNENYKKAKHDCSDSENSESCKANLLKAQRLWVQYKEAMAQVIWNMEGGGSNSRLSANYFIAEETKRQAKLLHPSGE